MKPHVKTILLGAALFACLGALGCSDHGTGSSTSGSTGAPTNSGSTGASSGSSGSSGSTGSGSSSGSSGSTSTSGSGGSSGAAVVPALVLTENNSGAANALFVYGRAADGSLTALGSVASGGLGTDAGLGDQGALAYNDAHQKVFAVNAGDDTISMFSVQPDAGVVLDATVASGGTAPVSVTSTGDWVYVLNAGGSGSDANITGFQIAGTTLSPIASSTQALSAANPGPAQIAFTPDGTKLVVTEKGTNKIDVFAVDATGVAGAVSAQNSNGATPYGFGFGPGGKLVVTEAQQGGAGAGTLSSYTVNANGTLNSNTNQLASQQSAPCWLAVSGNHAYAANAGSDSVTSVTIGADGTLTLVDSSGSSGTTGHKPIDEATTPDGNFLYVLNGSDHTLSIFGTSSDGTLTAKPDFGLVPATAAGLLAIGSTPIPGAAEAGAVYTSTNSGAGNEIAFFQRRADGSLIPSGTFSTGGLGTDGGLGDQGALALDASSNLLFAVNAGDDSISMMSLATDGTPSLLANVGSGGVMPISITEQGGYVYVLNAGDGTGANRANITGFQVTGSSLTAVPLSTQSLSSNAPAPAEIAFSPDGANLVVTEKGTGVIDVFPVTLGVAGAAVSTNSPTPTPYGFGFGPNGELLVTEANGGPPNLSSVSSYTLGSNGALTAVSSSVSTQQLAACWLAVAGSYAYAANAGSDSVSGFAIASDGSLTLLDASGVSGLTGHKPVDEAVTAAGDYLYVLNAADHSVSIFGVGSDGSLTKRPDFGLVPPNAAGLVAR